MKIVTKTKRLPIKYFHLVSGQFPNAGPNPSISGMKKQFWGMDSICVMCGQYLYYLGNKNSLHNGRLSGLAEKVYSLAK